LFRRLAQSQGYGYPAYINTGEYEICSASPELFFSIDGERIVTRPMKGTARRGRLVQQDREMAGWLQNSEKNRAENLMIVDMIRNDLGKIAKTGSVRVDRLFDIEKYPTLWQMTSSVSAQSAATITEIIAALFPCASITGAPKANTMKIISELESTPRNVYTGSIGYIGPNRKAQFNVAIRTVLIDRKHSVAEYGVGGGIVWDSGKADEYEECKVKARVLSDSRPYFSLLETMLWTPQNGYLLLDEHMQRITDSANYFDYAFDIGLVQARLKELVTGSGKHTYKVRLLVGHNGDISLQKEPLNASPSGKVCISLAAEPVQSDNIFLYHKTTNRKLYDHARSLLRMKCEDVLLWNERGEITETTIANVVVQIDGTLYTPPVTCGLLPGTFRHSLIQQGKIQEKVITISMLRECEKIFLVNSVRQWREAEIIEQKIVG
jgi:para-aminobenzoate synthetase/4-amino-4-deoxychorismate lyase